MNDIYKDNPLPPSTPPPPPQKRASLNPLGSSAGGEGKRVPVVVSRMMGKEVQQARCQGGGRGFRSGGAGIWGTGWGAGHVSSRCLMIPARRALAFVWAAASRQTGSLSSLFSPSVFNVKNNCLCVCLDRQMATCLRTHRHRHRWRQRYRCR